MSAEKDASAGFDAKPEPNPEIDTTSPRVADSFAALTLSTSSDDKSKTVTLPVMGERLREWLEHELLADAVRFANVPEGLGRNCPGRYAAVLDAPRRHARHARHGALWDPSETVNDDCSSRATPLLCSQAQSKRGSSGENSERKPRRNKNENRLYVKLLVSNAASGSVIGKMGVNIHQTQTTTGAKIQLSKPMNVFPGTNERTLMIRGNLCQLASAIYAIYIRLIEEDCAPIWKPLDEDDGAYQRHDFSAAKSEDASTSDGDDVGEIGEIGEIGDTGHRGDTGDGGEHGDHVDEQWDAGAGEGVSHISRREEEVPGTASENDDGSEDGVGNASSLKSTGTPRKASYMPFDATDMDVTEAVSSTQLQVKLLIPEEFVGFIVGRKGENVINICDTTNTKIKVFPQPNGLNCLTHQVLSIRGHLVDIIKAISMIVLKQADDPEFYAYANIPFTYYTRESFAPAIPIYAPYGMAGGMVSPHVGPGGPAMASGASSHGDRRGNVAIHMHPTPFVHHGAQNIGSSSGSPMVSLVVPLLPGQQSSVISNMSTIVEAVQSATGILLKLESVPGHKDFCARLDGPRDNVMMAINILQAQLMGTHATRPPMESQSFSPRWGQ